MNNKNNNGFLRNAFLYIIVIIAVVTGVQYFAGGSQSPSQQLSYTQLVKKIEDGKVKSITYQPDGSIIEVKGNYKKAEKVDTDLSLPFLGSASSETRSFTSTVLQNETTMQQLQSVSEAADVNVKMIRESSSGAWISYLFSYLPLIGIAIFFLFMMNQGGNRGAMNFGRNRAKTQSKENIKVRFTDVAGAEEEKEELEEQRKRTFSYQPLFSVVVPLYRTKPEFLKEMIGSIQAQTYGNWQLCLADGSLSGDDAGTAENGQAPVTELTPLLEQYAKADKRITFTTLPKNLGISGNTNAALALAAGDYIVLADHDDIVPANALYELADALNQDRSIDVLYSDEDKISMDGKKRFEPHFKPDFDLDLLCSVNYICHLFAAKKELVDMAGGFCSEYDGAQDLDFILRCCENAKNIRHIPKILYHWRCHMQSTAANPESKLYAFEAGRRAIEAHYSRIGVPAAVENAAFYGMYRTKYDWKEKPLVSIIIPNKDHRKDLETCVNSILEKTTYPNIEFIIVENNSTEQETFDYYKDLETMRENVHVVFYEGGFNYSKINNFGADAAKGSYLLLLNNDTEMIDGGAIGEMLGYCMRGDVGIVGAKLLYEDETIQHAGVVLGFGGTAGHAFIGKPRYDTGYFGRILCAQDYSAVTAACMMVKRSVFDEVGGLTEELAVAFNDIDFCLKVRKTGKLVVYDPYAEWFHYESKSRGYEDSPEKVERFNDEVDTLLRSWREIIEQGDPYYNPNLTLDNSDFSLRK